MDATGDFVVAWQSQGEDGSGYGVYAQRYQHAETSRTIDVNSGLPLTLAPISPIGGTNEIDQLALPSNSSVSFTLTWNGRTTGTIPYSGVVNKAFAQDVQDALAAVGIEATVSVVDSNDVAIEFVGGRGSQNQTAITSNNPAVTLKTVQEGVFGRIPSQHHDGQRSGGPRDRHERLGGLRHQLDQFRPRRRRLRRFQRLRQAIHLQ